MKCILYGRLCNKSQRLEAHLKEAARQINIDYELERVTEIIDIVTAGIMHTPALLADDKMVAEGKVASVSELKKRLLVSLHP